MGLPRLAAAAAAVQVVLFVFCSSSYASAACPRDAQQPSLDDPGGAASALVCDINTARAQNGLKPLRWNGRLWSGAQGMADDMASTGFFGHVTPDGRDLVARMRPTGYLRRGASWMLAENIAFGTNALSTPLSVALGWMDSAEHRANILDRRFRDIGIGVARGNVIAAGATGWIYVADFGKRARARAAHHSRRHRHRRR